MMETVNTEILTVEQIREGMTRDLEANAVRLNQQSINRYSIMIQNWRMNKDAGHEGPIPDPPNKYAVVSGQEGWPMLIEGTEPACQKYVPPPLPPAPPSGVAKPVRGADGKWYPGIGDTATDRQEVAIDGVRLRKRVVATPFGNSVWYEVA